MEPDSPSLLNGQSTRSEVTSREPRKLNNSENDEKVRVDALALQLKFVGVGILESIFNKKNGTPRQSGICPQSKGIIRLHKQLFNNPFHALEGIEQFQYVWILYHFHENKNKRRFIAKVRPPRLNGASCGIFASRAPHRPNPVGLTLAKIDCVKDGLLHVSGIDIIDGTPILDIKPYIAKYDSPHDEATMSNKAEDSNTEGECTEEFLDESQQQASSVQSTSVPQDWVNGSVVSDIAVDFTARSLSQLAQFHPKSFHEQPNSECEYCFRLFESTQECKQAIIKLLEADPRSVYRRNRCTDRLYFFTIDNIHITAWFDVQSELVEVLKVKPYQQVKHEQG